MIVAALALAALSAGAEPALRVFTAGDRAAAVYEKRIEFFRVPPQTIVTAGGLSAYGPFPGSGELVFRPELRPAATIRVVEPIAVPVRPERNIGRFLACTGRKGTWGTKRSSDNMCGVVDIAGRVLYEPPDDSPGGAVEALALSADGRRALFMYRRGKGVEKYLVWTQGSKKPRTYRPDPNDLALKRELNRFGLNDWNPEPESKPKPGEHTP